jgi:hypothetical protein
MSSITDSKWTGWAFFTGKNEQQHTGANLWARRIIGVIWFFVPWLIFILSRVPVFKTGNDDGKCVKWRPPSATYAVAWSFLIIFLILSWLVISREATDNLLWSVQVVLVFVVILLCLLWMYFYHQNKSDGIAVFIFLLFFLVLLLPISFKTNIYAGALLMPLLVWAIFQLGINCAEMTCTNKK